MKEPRHIIKTSPIHGRGLFASANIDLGEDVVVYTGELIAKAESARRLERGDGAFIFDWDECHDLDGNLPDNTARFVNHGCEPNCEAVRADCGIVLRALGIIQTGEELTFDYGFRLAAFPGNRCRCGAPSCTGFIVEKEERMRVRRLLNRRGRSILSPKLTMAQEGCS